MTTKTMSAGNSLGPSGGPDATTASPEGVTGTAPSIPRTMRAAVFDRPGPAEVLELREIATPVPRPDEVLVRVYAAGLNPKDAMIRGGAAGVRRTFPRATGFDLAGEVAAAGALVDDMTPGARVWGFLDGMLGGSAAEFVVVKRAWIARMPAGLEWSEAASLPLAASAALQALRDVARLRAGERVLIKGASGGVGSAAIQIAKALGAHVTAQVSAPARADAVAHVRALGADAVTESAPASVVSTSALFDVLVDCAGGSGYLEHRRLLSHGGRWVTVAPNLVVFALAPLSAVLTRFVGGPKMGFVIVRPRSADLDVLARFVARGALRMPVAEEFPLDSIVLAHRAMAERGVLGKRVVRILPRGARP